LAESRSSASDRFSAAFSKITVWIKKEARQFMNKEEKKSNGPGTLTKAAVALTALAVVVMIGWSQFRHASTDSHNILDNRSPVKIEIGGPFTLTDHTGKKVSDSDYRGRSMLIFFGYTYCPDVCPTELSTIAEAMDLLGPAKASQIQPLFISVDPNRDTPEVLAEYVTQFHPSIVGLTGTDAEIAEVAKSFRTYYARAKGSEGDDDYTVDHSATTFLMGPNGQFETTFSYGTPPETMAKALEKFIDQNS